MFQVRVSGGLQNHELPPIRKETVTTQPAAEQHYSFTSLKKREPRSTTNAFNEMLESDKLKTEVMVLRTKVKTLTDKLALKGTDNTKVLQLE